MVYGTICSMIASSAYCDSNTHQAAAQTKSFAEFFAGIGLMRMGLERQGWSVAFANDIDPGKLEMYAHQYSDASCHLLPGDIHDIAAHLVPTVALATASFPCTDLSLAGGRSGLGGENSSAFWEFVRILGEMRGRKPPIVLLENVIGFLTSAGGEDFSRALIALNELGYSVDAFVLDASTFVPQSRQRLFVVGTLRPSSYPRYVQSAKCFYESAVRPRQLADFIFMHPNIDWNIRTLPSPTAMAATLPSILEDLSDDDDQWWSGDRALYLLQQMAPRHRATAEHMMILQQWSFGTVFRRIRKGKCMAELRTDGIAGCLRTPKGGSGRQILFKAGFGRYHARLLTARECARLMGADEFRIAVPLNQALFGFGDAVCVPVVSWIAEHYLNPVFEELTAAGRLVLDKGARLVNA